LVAAKELKVKRVVFAASSSAYGETPTLPKVETMQPQPISPYGVNQVRWRALWPDVWPVLRPGKRLAPLFQYLWAAAGSQFAVFRRACQVPVRRFWKIRPRWFSETANKTRDFTYVENAVQANLLAV